MSDRDRDIKSPLSRETRVWEHAPAAPMRVPGGAPAAPHGPYRGRGPRGYVRSPVRIYEDLCDRLTENPFIDASEIDVMVAGTEVTLAGTVPDVIAMRQAQAIAEEVAGVSHVHNRLQLREAAERENTPGKAVNEALGTGEEP
jgi:osmotically-inducible protein OsmY